MTREEAEAELELRNEDPTLSGGYFVRWIEVAVTERQRHPQQVAHLVGHRAVRLLVQAVAHLIRASATAALRPRHHRALASLDLDHARLLAVADEVLAGLIRDQRVQGAQHR